MKSKSHLYLLGSMNLRCRWAGVLLFWMCYQPNALALQDSVKVFTADAFYEIILAHHPVAKQAQLLTETAKQEIKYAKGSFDPKLEVLIESKEFQDKSYYSKVDGYLTIPTRSPLTPKVGFENNSGELLNDIDKIPGNQQYLLGINLPVGRGLITDERRTALHQAKLLTALAEADQVKAINKLLLEATKEYWNWFYATEAYRITDRGTNMAAEILRRTKLNFQQGESSALDTVQAFIIWQARQIERQEASMELQNQLLKISNYLWDSESNPIQIKNSVLPPAPANQRSVTEEERHSLLQNAKEQHPELLKQTAKMGQLSFEKRLSKEFLKPRLDLSYSLLSQPNTVHVFDPANDYKFGLDFSMPILLRKERSKLAMINLKIRNTSWEIAQQQREIEAAVLVAINEVDNTSKLVLFQKEMVAAYQKLMQGEMLNLENGESDLFKINIQQEKLLQAQLKLAKSQAYYEKNRAYLFWAAGQKNLSFYP